MADPTAPKLLKLQADIQKVADKIVKMRSDITTMTSNPMGSNVELCKLLRLVRDDLVNVGPYLGSARDGLDNPVKTLENRKAKKAK